MLGELNRPWTADEALRAADRWHPRTQYAAAIVALLGNGLLKHVLLQLEANFLDMA